MKAKTKPYSPKLKGRKIVLDVTIVGSVVQCDKARSCNRKIRFTASSIGWVIWRQLRRCCGSAGGGAGL